MFKKIVTAVLTCAMAVSCLAFAGCSGTTTSDADLKVGAILIGDETEGYTLAHMNGMETAVAEIEAETGKKVELIYKKKVAESSDVESAALDLIANGCSIVITNSYGHQYYWGDSTMDNYPDVTFVSMTGDLAASSGKSNYFNAFTDVYEARYVSGVVAGMKIKELVDNGSISPETTPENYDENGNVKVGYVGAYAYAEVVSGYTAFFLGIKSVYENVSMTVKYTNSWFSEEREAAVAEYLRDAGCVIIGQHADSTGAPAAIQKTHSTVPNCYSVGYNVDMSDVAPDVILTSSTNNWAVYYKTLFLAKINGTTIPSEWSEGYSQDAVGITKLGNACADGTQAAVDTAVAAIKAGTIKVFDAAKYTVGGEHITTYTGAYGMNGAEAMKTESGVTYFSESTLRAAPYFDLRIDGITEVASDYTD